MTDHATPLPGQAPSPGRADRLADTCQQGPGNPSAAVHVRGSGALGAQVGHAVTGLVPSAPATCVVAGVPPRAPLAELSDARLTVEIGDPLEEVLGAVQDELAHLQPAGRLVFVLPAAPLMAVTGGAAGSAVAGGVLSIARTLAIELARESVTVNVVAVDADCAATSALTAQLTTLLGPGGEQITGQEIYLTAGSDLGRLRP